MDWFLLYLWTRIDSVARLSEGVAIGAGGLAALLLVYSFIEAASFDDENSKNQAASAQRWAKKFAVLASAGLALSVVIPSQKDIAIIVAGTATYRAVTSERGSKLASAFADYIEEQALAALKKKESK